MKIDENSQYWQRKSSYLLNDLRNFNGIFRKGVTYDSIKNQQKGGFTFSLEVTFLDSPHLTPQYF